MTDFNNVGVQNFGYVQNNNHNGYNNRLPVTYPATEDYDYDSFENSEKSNKGTTIALISIPVIAVAGLWLTKGKGWSKLKNMFGNGVKAKPQTPPAPTTPTVTKPPVTSSKTANETLARQKAKVETGITPQEAQAKVDAAIAGTNTLPPKAPAHETIRNVESPNANSAARREVEQAIKDTPTPAQQAAYNQQIAYKAPTTEETQIIHKVNAETAKASTKAHQIGNIVPEEQAAALRAAVSRTSDLNGVFKTKKGFTVTYENGNLKSIVAPDGRKITKPQTLYKYQDKIDIANLTAIAA